MAITKNMLLDQFYETGNDQASCESRIRQISDATDILSVKAREIQILSYCRVKKVQEAEPDGVIFYLLTDESVDQFLSHGIRIPMARVQKEAIGNALLRELEETTGLLFVINDERYLVSRSVLTTLMQRAAVSGENTVNRNNLARDLHLADGLFTKNEKISFVYRRAGEVNKIFAAFASNYLLTKQDILARAMDELKDFTLRSYHIDNSVTQIELDFPVRGAFTPGLIIRNSDTGVSSLTVSSVFRYGSEYAVLKECSLQHDKSLTYERLMETIAESRSAIDTTSFVDTMEQLKTIYIKDYDGFDGSNPGECGENEETAKSILFDAVNVLLGTPLAKTRKKIKQANSLLADAVDGEKKYSYFDIAILVFSVTGQLGLDFGTECNIRKSMANVPAYFSTLAMEKGFVSDVLLCCMTA